MGKPSKNKKEKVPKINEQQYAEYLSYLRGEEESQGSPPPLPTESNTPADLQ